MSELEKLLKELQGIKSSGKIQPQNSKELWNKIGSGENFADMGFESQEELNEFILNNPYSNI